jgi:hypothetical protein
MKFVLAIIFIVPTSFAHAFSPECTEPKDCAVVPSGCCSCHMGGTKKVIPMAERENYLKTLENCRDHAVCISRARDCRTSAVCKSGKCLSQADADAMEQFGGKVTWHLCKADSDCALTKDICKWPEPINKKYTFEYQNLLQKLKKHETRVYCRNRWMPPAGKQIAVCTDGVCRTPPL